MREFFRRVSPRRAVSDFAEQWSHPTPHRWQILGVACAATFCLFMLLIPESQRIKPAAPDLVFISTFEEGRTDAQIIAENCANQQAKDELEQRIAESEEARREMYRALGRATFIDVDEMEREAQARRAAEEGESEGPTEEERLAAIEEYCARAAG